MAGILARDVVVGTSLSVKMTKAKVMIFPALSLLLTSAFEKHIIRANNYPYLCLEACRCPSRPCGDSMLSEVDRLYRLYLMMYNIFRMSPIQRSRLVSVLIRPKAIKATRFFLAYDEHHRSPTDLHLGLRGTTDSALKQL